MKETPKKEVRNFLVLQKFRFDIALTFMIFLNFILLSFAASTDIQEMLKSFGLDIGKQKIIPVMILLCIIFTWIIGYILDVKVEYSQEFQLQATKRNPIIMKILENTKKLLNKR